MTNEQTAIKATYFSIISNTCLAIIKGLAGFFGNSYALLADAIESTTDIFASFLVLFGIKYSNRPADENHPYGHGRAEPLITFLVVGFLITSATIIAYESIQNIGTPHELPKAWTLIVLALIIHQQVPQLTIGTLVMVQIQRNKILRMFTQRLQIIPFN